MANGGLYERVLRAIEDGVAPMPTHRPRASASVVLWRRSGSGGLETYWVRRSPDLRFMGGWYGFPGGGVARRDSDVEAVGTPAGAGDAPREGGMPDGFIGDASPLDEILAPGVVVAALRELYEETGILLADDESLSIAKLAAARRRLLNREVSFSELLSELGAKLSASSLTYAGRWMTPPLGPMRFDNRFFLLEWPGDRPMQPEIIRGELVDGEWVEPGEALAAWEAGDALAAPPIVYILQVMRESGPNAGLSRLRDVREPNLGSLRRVEFKPGVMVFPLATPTLPPATHTNCYLLGFEECVLVDPGTPYATEQERLIEALREVEARLGRKVQAVWLTHHHPDHVGAVEAVRERLRVPVFAHAATAEKLRAIGIEIDGTLVDGDVRRLNGERAMDLAVVGTPGHARGHLCFFDVQGRSLIAGDMVSAVSTIVIDPPEGDMDDYIESLGRLRSLRPDTLFPGHGPAIAQADEKLEELIDHREWREQEILRAWRRGLREPQAMLPEVYDDVPQRAWPLAERQILAHLERLRRAGRIEDDS